MTKREQLHARIDALPEELLPQVEALLAQVDPLGPKGESPPKPLYASDDVFAWYSPENHPEWATDEGIDRWVRELRAEWDHREKRNGIGDGPLFELSPDELALEFPD
jgi:hypothetical protein